MNPKLKPLAALLIAAGYCLPSAAGTAYSFMTTPGAMVVSTSADSADGAEVILVAGAESQARMAVDGEGKHERHLEVITSGPDSFGDMAPLASLGSLAELGTVFSSMSFDPSGRGIMMRSGKNVKNAPYSAEVISETVQTLADGNQISKKNSSFAYRDSAGSTRQEVRDSKGEVKNVHIHDAVSGSNYSLSPAKKTATKFPAPPNIKINTGELKEKPA